MNAQRRPYLKAIDIREQNEFYVSGEDDFSSSSHARQEKSEKIRMLFMDMLGRWYLIVFGLSLGVFVGVYVLSKTPKKYTATTVLELKEPPSALMSKENVTSQDVMSLEGMNTVAAQIVRPELLERAAERKEISELTGIVSPKVDWVPDWLPQKMGDALRKPVEELPVVTPDFIAGMISSALEVKIQDGTRLLQISVTHQVPEVSRVFADAVAKEYVEGLVNDQDFGRGSSIKILEKQSDEARLNLQRATGSLAIYNRAIEIHRVLDTKEAEYNRLKSRYLPKHPKMVAAAAEIGNLEKQFLREYEVASNSPNEMEYWKSIVDDMPDPKEDPDRYFLIARQQILARNGVLESEIRSATSVFNGMLTLMEESLVDRQSVNTSAEISSLARLPGGPSSPNTTNLVGMFGFAGLSAGFFLALAFTLMDDRFHTVSQFSSETGGNVLACVADLKTRHLALAEREFLKRNPEEAKVGPSGSEKWDSRILFRKGVSYTNFAEMYRVLRASVSLLGDENSRKVTVFSSALPGEGKTVTSVNFALAAAAQGHKTLLIDLDLRRPSLHKLFGFKAKANPMGGSCEFLADKITFEDSVFTDTGIPHLHMILAGKRPANPGECINSNRLMALLEEARSKYDVIVVDSAPLLPVPDTRVLAPLADNFCIVCRANYVPKGAVKDLLEILREDGTEISGFVFNGFDQKRRLLGENRSYGYYSTSRSGKALRFGYGSYGAYGSDYED